MFIVILHIPSICPPRVMLRSGRTVLQMRNYVPVVADENDPLWVAIEHDRPNDLHRLLASGRLPSSDRPDVPDMVPEPAIEGFVRRSVVFNAVPGSSASR
jgi:hypothetical protein